VDRSFAISTSQQAQVAKTDKPGLQKGGGRPSGIRGDKAERFIAVVGQGRSGKKQRRSPSYGEDLRQSEGIVGKGKEGREEEKIGAAELGSVRGKETSSGKRRCRRRSEFGGRKTSRAGERISHPGGIDNSRCEKTE